MVCENGSIRRPLESKRQELINDLRQQYNRIVVTKTSHNIVIFYSTRIEEITMGEHLSWNAKTFGQIGRHNRKASWCLAVRNTASLAQNYFNVGYFVNPLKIVIFTLWHGRSCVLEKRGSLWPIKPDRMHVEYFKGITETVSVSTKRRPGGFVLRLSGAICVCTHNRFVYHYCCISRKDFRSNVIETSDAILLPTDPPYVVRTHFCTFECAGTKL